MFTKIGLGETHDLSVCLLFSDRIETSRYGLYSTTIIYIIKGTNDFCLT